MPSELRIFQLIPLVRRWKVDLREESVASLCLNVCWWGGGGGGSILRRKSSDKAMDNDPEWDS